MTPSQVEENLLERDLILMSLYARKHMLPARRLQRQMAMVAQLVHADPTRPFSFYDVSLWGITPVVEDADDGDLLGLLAASGGGNVVQLSRTRKKKAVN